MADDSPQTSVVWCDFDGQCVRVNTMRGFVKERNMRRNPRVTLWCYDLHQPLRYLEVRGAVVEMTQAGAAEHLDNLASAYAGQPIRYFGDAILTDQGCWGRSRAQRRASPTAVPCTATRRRMRSTRGSETSSTHSLNNRCRSTSNTSQLLGRRHDPVEHPPGIGEAEQRIPGARDPQHRAADAAVPHARGRRCTARPGIPADRRAAPADRSGTRRRVSGWPQTRLGPPGRRGRRLGRRSWPRSAAAAAWAGRPPPPTHHVPAGRWPAQRRNCRHPPPPNNAGQAPAPGRSRTADDSQPRRREPTSGPAGRPPYRWRPRPGVAVGVDANHAVDGAGQPAHRHGSSLSLAWSCRPGGHRAALL